MRVIAVPVKSLERTKTRLGPAMAPLERAALTLTMLEDLLDAAVAVPNWRVWVVSPDEAVLEIAARRRARPVVDAGTTLTGAVGLAERLAVDEGVDALAILLGDLPLVTVGSLGKALRTIGPVVACPSLSDDGTNLLLRRPPQSIVARFGTSSFEKHRRAALDLGLPFAEFRAPEIAFDLDRPEDIPVLLARGPDTRTAHACREMGFPGRLVELQPTATEA